MSVLYVRDKDGRLIPVGSKAAPPDLSDYVRSVNGVEPDENGNVKITIPDSGGNVDQTVACENLDLFYSALIRRKANPKEPLSITTYPGGNNQPTHPKVLYFANGWNGHKYWMAYTPYPGNNNQQENPCITYSDDGISWSEEGISNPIIATEHSGCWWSDPHLVYIPETNTMELWVRWCSNGADGMDYGWEGVYRLKSTDGVHWSEKEYLYHVVDTAWASVLSPSVIYENGKYKIWICYKRNCLKYFESADGTNWQYIKDISTGITPIGEYKVWHFDVIKTEKGYEFVGCYQLNGAFDKNNYIAYSWSADNQNYAPAVCVLANGASGQFDDLELYRPCLVKIGNKYRMYYGAQKNRAIWHIGVVETPNMYLLNELLVETSSVTLPEYNGSSGGDDVHTHSYSSTVTTAATCTTAGVRTYTCSCGEKYTESIPATGHNYVDGTCSKCGAVDPEYKPEVTLTSISATYSGGDVPVETAVTDLTGIVVTAHYSDGSTEAVTGYTLSGKIAEGSNTVTVTYQGKTATFTVTGVAESGIDGVVNNFDKSAWTIGYINDEGGITQDKSYHHSDYMPIDKTYHVGSGTRTYSRITYADADLNVVGTVTFGSKTAVKVQSGDVANAVYFAVSANTASKDEISVIAEEHEIAERFDASAWKPAFYNDDGILLKQINLHHSDYLPIATAGGTVTTTLTSNSYLRISYFDADYKFLEYDRGGSFNASSLAVKTNIANAVYYVINCNTNDKSKVSVS